MGTPSTDPLPTGRVGGTVRPVVTDEPRPVWLLAGATALISLMLCLLGAELLLRLAGRGPLVFDADPNGEAHYGAHPRLGWVHEPGVFDLAGAQATFLPDGSRATGPPRADAPSRAIVVIGGSFSEGYGVDDARTFAWLLQERFPGHRVINQATGGYGTLQSLYAMEDVLARLGAEGVSVDAVVYGYMWHHPTRNVAKARWRRLLNDRSRGGPGNPVRIPYALIEQGELRHFPPDPWPAIAWSTRSALVRFAVDQWVRLATGDRADQKDAVTLALLDEMDHAARAAGTRLLVTLLHTSPDDALRVATHLDASQVPYANCTLPNFAQSRYRDPRTLHPTAVAHVRYADCIAYALEKGFDLRPR